MGKLDEGLYYGEIMSADATSSRKKGTPQVSIQFKITHVAGPTGEWVPVKSALERWVHLSLHPNARDFSEEKLVALGFQGFGSMTFAEKGAELSLMQDSEYGESWELGRGGGGKPESLDATKVAELDALWKAKHAPKPAAAAPPPAAPAAAPAAAPHSTPPGADDNIPF